MSLDTEENDSAVENLRAWIEINRETIRRLEVEIERINVLIETIKRKRAAREALEPRHA